MVKGAQNWPELGSNASPNLPLPWERLVNSQVQVKNDHAWKLRPQQDYVWLGWVGIEDGPKVPETSMAEEGKSQ